MESGDILSKEPEAIEPEVTETESAEPEEISLEDFAKLTAEEMLSVDDKFLTPEQLKTKTEWRDAVLVMILAEGVKESFRKIITGQGNGTYRNNKFYDGYKQALNDIYEKLIAIVPDDYKDFTKRMEEEQAKKIAEFNEKIKQLDEETDSSRDDN
jgi:hypothetical protein